MAGAVLRRALLRGAPGLRGAGLCQAGRGLRRCERAEEVDATLEKALATDDQAVVVDFRVDAHEGVFPMVPAGRPNDEIILGPEFSPEEQAAATRREVRLP